VSRRPDCVLAWRGAMRQRFGDEGAEEGKTPSEESQGGKPEVHATGGAAPHLWLPFRDWRMHVSILYRKLLLFTTLAL